MPIVGMDTRSRYKNRKISTFIFIFIMKKTLFISVIFVSATFACEKQEHEIEQRTPPIIVADCSPEGTDFRFAYDYYVALQADYFFIKGNMLDAIPSGISVKPIEDLKGNFPSTSPVTIWFGGDAGLQSSTQSYQQNDTLLIICQSAAVYGQEYSDDMVMLSCSPSVLQVSGEYVSGYIYAPYAKDTVLWNELKSQLLSLNR
jgi:hypothetical protein